MSYQEEAYKFAQYSGSEYPFLALGEEAGEVLGKLAKYVRKNNLSLEDSLDKARGNIYTTGKKLKEDLVSELGDVMWQLSACCTELGVTLEEVQQVNLDKLGGRVDRGTIIGSGDNR